MSNFIRKFISLSAPLLTLSVYLFLYTSLTALGKCDPCLDVIITKTENPNLVMGLSPKYSEVILKTYITFFLKLNYPYSVCISV